MMNSVLFPIYTIVKHNISYISRPLLGYFSASLGLSSSGCWVLLIGTQGGYIPNELTSVVLRLEGPLAEKKSSHSSGLKKGQILTVYFWHG